MGRSRRITLGFAAVLGAVACVFVIAVLIGRGLEQASLWAGVLGLPVGLVTAGAVAWATVTPQPNALAPPEQVVPEWVVDRPTELSEIVARLLEGRGGTGGISTALQGAGGFGKTTLARVVCADNRVRRRFGRYVYWVTVGRDVGGGAALAAKVNDVIKLVAGEDATFTDPELAGDRLGALLDTGPRRLLVLDDVWAPGQLAPFARGGRRCSRLVTTRVPGLLGERGVPVDEMSQEQAQKLLTSGLPPLNPAVVEGLLAVTGRWPLLLRLVNKILANAARAGSEAWLAAGGQLLERLQTGGPAVVDILSGETSRGLKVGEPLERARAVRATIEASTNPLDAGDVQRFAELGVFVENETIPFRLVARLWRATGGLDDLQAAQLCARLGELALVSSTGSGGMTLHDVVRDFVRRELSLQRLVALNGLLVDAIAIDLPAADLLGAGAPGPTELAWWKMDRTNRYQWDHLIKHLLDAGRQSDAERVAGDLRWVGARLQGSGPAAPAADLSLVGTPRTDRLLAVLTRTAHLLARTEPAGAVVDVLHSRVAGDPDWGPQAIALRDLGPFPRLVNRWPLPDLPDAALRRVLAGHTGWVTAVALAPDGSWLATGDEHGTVLIWDAATGRERATLTGHDDWVNAVAVAPDGSWLVTGGHDGVARIWDPVTGQVQATLCRNDPATPVAWVNAVAVAPDGSWLATAGTGGTIRIWDPVTGQVQATLTAQADIASQGPQLLDQWRCSVNVMSVAPDGSWLATGGNDAIVRIWDMATGQARASLTSHDSEITAMAIAPDGRWLVTGGSDGTVRIWDAATWQVRASLTGHNSDVTAVAVAPDGTWLATSGTDGMVRIWDAASGQLRATLTGDTTWINGVAVAPNGTWLVTVGNDRTARIWDTATEQQEATFTGQNDWQGAVAAAPDGSWLVAGGRDGIASDRPGIARIWDAATGQVKATLTGHSSEVSAVAVSPDGRWLATAATHDESVLIWDAATGQQQATLAGHTRGVTVLAIAADGNWLATGGHDGTVRIFEVDTGRQWATLSHGGRVTGLAVAPDSSWLAITADREESVRIWDAARGRERAIPTGFIAYAMAVAPDGSWLATGDNDWTVRIWDTATGRQRASLSHHDWVHAMAIAPDGRWLATGGEDGTLRIWDPATGSVLALMRVEHVIHACAWLGEGGLAVVGEAGLYVFDFLPSLIPRPDSR